MRTTKEIQEEMNAFEGKKTTKAYRSLKEELGMAESAEAFGAPESFDSLPTTEDVGLGDVVETITKATGIKAIVDKVSDVLGFDCGCDERKDKLNKIKLFSKKRVINCPSKEELVDLKELLDGIGSTLSRNQQVPVVNYYNSIFSSNKKVTSCGSCAKSMIDELRLYIKTIED